MSQKPSLDEASLAVPSTESSAPSRPLFGRRSFLRWTGLAGAAGVAASLFPPFVRDAFAQITETIGTSTFTPIRPPAVPLAVRSMYLSAWSPSNTWPAPGPPSGPVRSTRLTGLVRVDGTPYVFCGAPSGGYALATQLSLTVTGDPLDVRAQGGRRQPDGDVPLARRPDNLQRQCVPMSYVTVSAAANDGASHTVSVYMDISGEWAHGDIRSAADLGAADRGRHAGADAISRRTPPCSASSAIRPPGAPWSWPPTTSPG